LLSYVPKPTGPLLLATGRAGGLEWEFWAQESPLSGDVPVTATRVSGVLSPPMFAQRGLCTFIFFVHAKGAEGGSGPCGDPRQLSRFQFGQQGPGTDLNAAMLLGVTSLLAEWVRIGFSGATPALVVKTLAPRQLPGVRFFVASLPDSAMTSIEALGPRNNVVYRYSQQLPLVPLTTWQAHG
jgi:hypothetical protein